jgi:hypothetical protein
MLKKFKPKGAFSGITYGLGNTYLNMATATDEQVEALRQERPETFNTYFEEVKASKVAEPTPQKGS